jgi:hypothetical protein
MQVLQFETSSSLTIKDIRLDLLPSVTKPVKGIRRLVSKGTVLHRCDNSDEDIVLQTIQNTTVVIKRQNWKSKYNLAYLIH